MGYLGTYVCKVKFHKLGFRQKFIPQAETTFNKKQLFKT